MNENAIFWITGLSGAGKTTVAQATVIELNQTESEFILLDGDMLRNGLCKDLGFSMKDRQENIRRVAEVSKLLLKNRKSVLCTFISPTHEIRKMAKAIIGTDYFKEIYINTPLEICENRDPKGLYKKVRNGEISNFTGISSAYEKPTNPDLILDCHNHSLPESVKQLKEFITTQLN